MKAFIYISSLFAIAGFSACDDQIYPDLDNAPSVLVVDAWINDKSEDQVINISKTQAYFDNSEIGGVAGAEVFVTDQNGIRFDFLESENGAYVWPYSGVPFGTVGDSYFLTVNVEGETYTSQSTKNRVPEIDSVTFRFDLQTAFGQEEEYYLGEFWSRDPEGYGDTYWIKSYKNEEFLGKPSEINIAYDAGFSAGGAIDGLIFIPPIRDGVNPYEEDPTDEETILSPYEDGDSLYVEIHSISNAAHSYLNEVIVQTNRPGGFAALFDTPLSNVSTNIINTTSEDPVVGFFCVSSVSADGARLDVSQVPKED